MTIANLPFVLRANRRPTLVVTFDDGDRYSASSLDMWGENEDGEFEIHVKFDDCLGASNARHAARNRRVPGCFYQSQTREPFAMLYSLERIASLYDDEGGYFLFERDSSRVGG
jgi:hypothetical protein